MIGFLVTGASAFGQGTITFFNNNLTPVSGAPYRAGIFYFDGTGLGSHPGFTAGLIKGSDPTVAPLATTTFRTTTATEVFAATQDVAIPGIAPGSTAVLTVAVWQGASYSAAVSSGFGNFGFETFTSRALGGPNPDPTQPAIFTPDMGPGFHSFNLVIPEPSTIALGVIGLGTLLLRRRK